MRCAGRMDCSYKNDILWENMLKLQHPLLHLFSHLGNVSNFGRIFDLKMAPPVMWRRASLCHVTHWKARAILCLRILFTYSLLLVSRYKSCSRSTRYKSYRRRKHDLWTEQMLVASLVCLTKLLFSLASKLCPSDIEICCTTKRVRTFARQP